MVNGRHNGRKQRRVSGERLLCQRGEKAVVGGQVRVVQQRLLLGGWLRQNVGDEFVHVELVGHVPCVCHAPLLAVVVIVVPKILLVVTKDFARTDRLICGRQSVGNVPVVDHRNWLWA